MISRQHGAATRTSGVARSTRNETKLSTGQGSRRSQPGSQRVTDQHGGESRFQQTQQTSNGSRVQGGTRESGRVTGRQTAGTLRSNLVQSRISNKVIYRHTPSIAGSEGPLSNASQYEGEEGDEYEEGDDYDEEEDDEQEEEEVEEDEESEYSIDYYPEYAPEVEKVYGPRVELLDGPEPCSCFPKKSNKNVPSMVYEKIKCSHSGVQGEPHAGVFRFDFNWNEFMEEPKRRKRSQPPPKTTFVKGYPNPEFLVEYNEDDEDEDTVQQEEEDDDDYDYSTNDNDDFDGYDGEQYRKKGRFDDYEDDDYDDDDYDDEEDDEEGEDDEEKERQDAIKEALSKPSGIRAIIPLPQIGYSPPPSRERTTPMSQRSNPYSLPPLPESPFMSAQKSERSYAGSEAGSRLDTRESQKGRFRMKKAVNTVRRFQGRMYDPVSKKVVSYDITPAFRASMNTWDAHIDSGASTATGSRLSRTPGTRQSTVPSRRSVKLGSRPSNIPEEDDEDEEYDEEEDSDYDDEDNYR